MNIQEQFDRSPAKQKIVEYLSSQLSDEHIRVIVAELFFLIFLVVQEKNPHCRLPLFYHRLIKQTTVSENIAEIRLPIVTT